MTGGAVYNYGYLLITLNGQQTQVPPSIQLNTIYQSAANLFDLSQALQVWQLSEPGIFCQSLTFTPLLQNVSGVMTYSYWMNVFDQCTYDWTLFVGVVAGVGGAIIAATVIAAIISVILTIKKSREQFGTKKQYVEMDRS